ncbi:MAG: hypothetical protein ACFCVA_13035 [Gammaproteobacteria bacterium]
MAQVPILAKWQEASAHLQMLKGTVAADIRPLLDVPGHAPFAICRETLSYIDHLGHLYSGRGQVADRSREFMKQVMAKVDSNYGKRAAELYQMFRCGPVHEFEPKVLENKKGELLAWFCYLGPRVDSFEVNGSRISVVHLEPVASGAAGRFWLPVSTKCLIEDLMCSMEVFEKTGPENERVTAWNRGARDLNIPEPYDFTP